MLRRGLSVGSVGPARMRTAVRRLRARLGRAAVPLVSRGSNPDPWAPIDHLVPGRGPRTVVVLADRSRRAELRNWTRRFSHDRVRILGEGSDPEWGVDGEAVSFAEADSLDKLSWQLRLLGPVDVVADLRRVDITTHWATWRRLFLYLRPDGLYVIDQSMTDGSAFSRTSADRLGTLLAAGAAEPGPGVTPLDQEIAASTGTVQLSRELIAVTKRQRHLVKLRESDANRVLVSRDPRFRLDVLATLPAGEFASAARVTSHRAEVDIPWLPERIAHPTLHLRHYRSAVVFAGSTLTFTDDVILPDSFRHHLMANPNNPRIVNVAASFGRVPDRLLPTEDLSGDYYQLDSSYSGHFGHFMTEVISRLWGWDLAKERIPDLKAVVRIKHVNERETALEKRLFAAYGIPESDVVCLDHPVRLTSLVSAAPMWHNQDPHYVHPQLVRTFDRLRDGLLAEPRVLGGSPAAPGLDQLTRSDDSAHGKIFVSRTGAQKRRTCRNATVVEQFFTDRGFSVVYPERYDLADQARIFARAEVVAGFGGSAIFNVLYARQLQTMIVLSHEAYTARNEHLFSSVIGADVHYFWSAPDVAHPKGGWQQAAFDSDWEFDFDRNARDLDAVLSAL